MNHEALRERLVDLALGLLPPAEAQEVEAHAAGCTGCAAELASLRGARAALVELPPLPAPERGEAVLLAAARQAAEAGAAPRRAALPRWLWGAALGAASAAVALLLTVRLAGSPPPSRFDERLEPEPTPLAAAPQEIAQPAGAGAGPRTAPAAPPRPPPARPAKALAPVEAPLEEREVARREASSAALAAVDASEAKAAPPGLAAAPPPPPAPAARVEARAEAWAPAADAPAGDLDRPGGPPALVEAPAPTRAAGERAAERPGLAGGAASDAARPAAHAELLVFPGCPGERSRTLTRDGAGRLVRRQRIGALAGAEYSAEESFGEDGRLLGALVRLGGREILLDRAALARDGLEPLPGLRLAPTAAAAEAEPARCGP